MRACARRAAHLEDDGVIEAQSRSGKILCGGDSLSQLPVRLARTRPMGQQEMILKISIRELHSRNPNSAVPIRSAVWN